LDISHFGTEEVHGCFTRSAINGQPINELKIFHLWPGERIFSRAPR